MAICRMGVIGGLAATAGEVVEIQADSIVGMPKTFRFTGGSSIAIRDAAIDLSGATVIFDADFGTKTDVLSAASITGRPRVVSARTGKTIPFSIGNKNGFSVLTVVSSSPSLRIVFK